MKLLFTILLGFFLLNPIVEAQQPFKPMSMLMDKGVPEITHDFSFLYITIHNDETADINVMQFTFEGDFINHEQTFGHEEGSKVYTVTKWSRTYYIRVKVNKDCYVYQVSENGMGGECKLLNHYVVQ